ncbi:hypothetical protein SBADM41S_06010 [Streptomyces badius]
MAVAGPEVGIEKKAARPAGGGSGRRGAAVRLGLMAVPAAFFALFFAYPVTAIVGRGFKAEGDWQFGRIGDVLSRPDILDVLWFTTWQALASTALTLLIALPGAYVFARFDFPGKQVLRAVATVPFVLPTVVVGTAFLALLGRGGLLDELWGVRLDTTVWAILLAHVFFNYAVVVRTVGGLWSQLDPRQEEAARVLGAGRFAAFRRVTLPALAPAVAAAALMVFLFTFTSFGVVQILGGPAYSTLEVEIYRQTAQLLDLPTAAVLTLVQFAAVGGILAVHAATVRRRERALKLVDAAHDLSAGRRGAGRGAWAPATTRPSSYARITACARSRSPIFANSRLMWVFTVWSVMVSRSAMSALDNPRAIRTSTSASRAVSPSTERFGGALTRCRANSAMSRPVISGASRAWPPATTRTACSSSGKVASFSRKPLAPAVRASYTYSSRPNVVSISALVAPFDAATISRAASMPPRRGIRMSNRATSGRSSAAPATACTPSSASPTTSMSSCVFDRQANAVRTTAWSSATSTRITTAAPPPRETRRPDLGRR